MINHSTFISSKDRLDSFFFLGSSWLCWSHSHPCLQSSFSGTETKLSKLSSEGRVEPAIEEGVVAGGGHGDHVCEDEEEV